jgi:putative transposase
VLVREHQLSIQRACRVVRLSRTAYYQPPQPASRRDAAVIAALTDAVARYPRWGFWKLFDRLRVEGRPWNHKHVHPVYCALRLNLPRRTTRRVPRRIRQPLTAPPVLNQTSALDFMTETLYDGRRVRLLTMIDEGNREGLEIAMGSSLFMAGYQPCASTTVQNSPRSPSSTGARNTASPRTTFSQESRTRTRTSNVSTEATEPRC